MGPKFFPYSSFDALSPNGLRIRTMRLTSPALRLALFLSLGSFADAQVVLAANHDAAIYEESGSLANGSGMYLFAGENGQGNIRRSLLSFDIAAALPAGSQITSVTLRLDCNQAASPSEAVTVHRLLASWSEGPSDPSGGEGSGVAAGAGDVTWTQRNFGAGQPWSVPGGDFVATSSAGATAPTGPVLFASTPQLVADVQSWLDQPASNFGWILRSNETAPSTARRFDSRHGLTPGLWPTLVIDFAPGCPSGTNFCVLSPNSAGPGASIFGSGSTSVALNRFGLNASGCPASTNGLFYFGAQTAQLPFGNGTRCVGGPQRRLGALTTSATGGAQYLVDFTTGSGASILAGSTWHFQFWFRDNAAGGAGFNLSDGLSATFCP